MGKPFGQKAIFIWDIQSIGGGDPAKITQMLVDAGFEGAYLHSVNLSGWRTAARIGLARALQAAGLKAYGSSGVYGDTPALEGQLAAQIVEGCGLDGFIFDAEGVFDAKPTPDSNAVHLLQAYKAGTGKPCAWCWWAHYENSLTGAAWHPKAVLAAAMQYADVGMPMAYPSGGDSPANYAAFLSSTFAQWRRVTQKPIVPAGRAYIGDGGTPSRANTLAWEQAARSLGAAGVSWWSMQHAVVLPDLWQTLRETKGFSTGGGETTMWTNNAIGFYTASAQGAAWDNPSFNFVVAFAGGNWTAQNGGLVLEPNSQLGPIETKAHQKSLPCLMLWDFDVDFYRRQQFDANDNRWPPESQDYPLQALIAALKNRAPDSLIIRVMNRKNLDGGNEMMSYVAFAARKFVERANRWLYQNKGLNKWTFVLTNDEFLRIDGQQEYFYAWAKDWYLGIEQQAVLPLDQGAWPQSTDRIKALPPSQGWKLWYHYNTATLDMMIWNGDNAAMREFLGLNAPAGDLVPPSAPGNLAAEVSGSTVKLSWSPSTDNVGVEGYGVWLDSVYKGSSAITQITFEGIAAGSHTFEVDAFDKGGNHSARATVTAAVSADTGGPVSREEFDTLAAEVAELWQMVAHIREQLHEA